MITMSSRKRTLNRCSANSFPAMTRQPAGIGPTSGTVIVGSASAAGPSAGRGRGRTLARIPRGVWRSAAARSATGGHLLLDHDGCREVALVDLVEVHAAAAKLP